MTLPEPGWWTAHCDGSAVPNPGRMGLGVWLTGPQGQVHTVSLRAHDPGCNNEAELLALMAAMTRAAELGATHLKMCTDNSVIVEQLMPPLAGRVVRPLERLEPLLAKARSLMQAFDQLQLNWVPRHRNVQADALARAALGMAPKASRHRLKKKR